MTAPDGRGGSLVHSQVVAALFVTSGGVYYDVPGVDPWDEERDARLYAGPHPVVAHPPCKAWSLMGQCRPEIVTGDDGGCFEAALTAVRRFDGVLEHPAHTKAWRAFGLATPPREGWYRSLFDDGWVCSVDQAWYGHRANKRTWLYYVGSKPPEQLTWGAAPFTGITVRNDGGGHTRPDGSHGSRSQLSATPLAFRDLLIAMARSARAEAPLCRYCADDATGKDHLGRDCCDACRETSDDFGVTSEDAT